MIVTILLSTSVQSLSKDAHRVNVSHYYAQSQRRRRLMGDGFKRIVRQRCPIKDKCIRVGYLTSNVVDVCDFVSTAPFAISSTSR